MERLLRFALTHLIQSGSLTVSVASHPPFRVGDGSGPPVVVHLRTARAARRLLLNPDMSLGELYMDGDLEIREGGIDGLLALAMRNYNRSEALLPLRFTRLWRRLFRIFSQLNVISRSHRNVAHHYDMDGRLYALFLDRDLQYSCAYYEDARVSGPDDVEAAQLAKKRHIAAKLLVEPGHRVLDIGSGWGGMALYLAKFCGASVTGITLSNEQLSVSRARARELGVADAVHFALTDYREIDAREVDVKDDAGHDARYDRIVSIGMFEHVGVPWYQAFFNRTARLLADDGVMLLHSIGRMDGPGNTNPWIARYIFPGGYIPALSEVLPAIERAGLIVTDIEILRLHYAETLKAWRQRFHAQREQVLTLFDERFFRMFDFYLAASEMAFRHDGMMVFQVQFAKRQDAVPLTRAYIPRREAILRLREREIQPKPAVRLRQAGE